MTLIGPSRLPEKLYTAERVHRLDRCAIEQFGIPGLTLMQRAGATAFGYLQKRWSEVQRLAVICGTGNNGGDGYVVARLALEAGLSVQLLQMGDGGRLSRDALACAREFRQSGGRVEPFQGVPEGCDLVVDAVLGTGLEREVTGAWGEMVRAVNRHPAPVLALDMPSGLHSDSGCVMGCAVQADATVTFIGLKQGLFTGEGPDLCGEIMFDDLGVPAGLYDAVEATANRMTWTGCARKLQPRRRTAHKGNCGHLLVVGGDSGFSGALQMAGEAAARTGAGLVSLATRAAHAALVSSRRPELMSHGVESATELAPLLVRADVVAIGPGLGQRSWGRAMLGRVLESGVPMVVDADALNLLAQEPTCRDNWVLTPHPGEAARLLGCSVAEIQSDRFQAARSLQQRYGGVVLLKGAGTLVVEAADRLPGVCVEGNPGMASGGMGDLLTGIIGGLMAQGESPGAAARMGVCLHGQAADLAAREGERGMLATDLLPNLRRLLNPEGGPC
ncbi:MAG: NAD(P)H-hydrate dehydratase [Sedimenticola sp.]|nr:NAD(P)H-hydrate dehydratase [Sedimenticola sp.]